MLVIISDIHLEEEVSRDIEDVDNPANSIHITRNVNPKAFDQVFTQWHEQAARTGIQQMDLVLAGDIFEMHRTALWFSGEARPYVDANEATIKPGSPLELKILEILNAINAPDSDPGKVLELIRKLGAGEYMVEKHGERFYIPPENIHIHYCPGNHDRMANGTPAIRKKVRQMLGMGDSDARFPHYLEFEKERTLVRHGHEYDHFNFGADLREQIEKKKGAIHIDDADYDKPTFGDFVTVDIASRLSYQFRQHHGDSQILTNSTTRSAYERIIEFDDLRPQMAGISFLMRPYVGRSQRDKGEEWNRLFGPVLSTLLDDVHEDPFLTQELKELDKFGPDFIDIIQAAIRFHAWRAIDESYTTIEKLAGMGERAHGKGSTPELYAAREPKILNGSGDPINFVVGGHTHRPTAEFIGAGRGEQFYLNTGTWRRRIFSNADYSDFGRVKSLTYIMIYGPDEDKGSGGNQEKLVSFDLWSGMTERWFKPET